MFEKTFTDDSFEESIEKATEGRELSLDRFAAELAQGTYRHLGELAELISKNSQNWKISRISRVALSALRVAVYEMLYERNIPVSYTHLSGRKLVLRPLGAQGRGGKGIDVDLIFRIAAIGILSLIHI